MNVILEDHQHTPLVYFINFQLESIRRIEFER